MYYASQKLRDDKDVVLEAVTNKGIILNRIVKILTYITLEVIKMEMYICEKDYFRESKEVQTAIVKSMNDLYKRIKMYEVQNIDFDKIYNVVIVIKWFTYSHHNY